MTWYDTTQEENSRAGLIADDMWGCRTVPTPDNDEMLDDDIVVMRSVTAQEHKWIRSNVGSMGLHWGIITAGEKTGQRYGPAGVWW